ncbi:MAG: FmdB family zinc ribbon protein [Balneolaceae bacterium]|nr:FmdB family zinc ribbon protein [Balneolaceae bacterium]
MPTYEYKREDGTTFEIWQNINDDPLEECPTTGQKVKRVITGGGGVVYKGDGWYVTDYKNRDRPKKEDEKNDKSTGAADSGTGESDSSNNA